MAAIDKTYVSTYEDWKRVVDWARTAEFTCPNGTKLKVINHCYYPDMSEAEVKEWLCEQREVPVMNTSYSMDYYLIKYCPLDIVQNQLRQMYGEQYDNIKNGKSRFDTFTRKRKIGTKVVLKKWKKHTNQNYVSGRCFWVSAMHNGELLWWSDAINRFIWTDELGIRNSSQFLGCKSIKALIRRLRKMELPKGAVVCATGRYVYEKWEFVIK